MEFTNITENTENSIKTEIQPIAEILENPEIKTEPVNNEQKEPEKKKSRGRPKKENNEIKAENTETTKKEPKKNDSEKGEKDLKSFLSDFKTETANPTQPTSENITQNPTITPVISGYMLLLICDFVFPSLIVLIVSKASKNLKKKITAKNLKLTKEEKKELEPLSNEAVKYMFSEMHPLTAFAVSLGSVYIGKTFEAIGD